MTKESTQSESEETQGLPPVPPEAVTTDENFLGRTGEDGADAPGDDDQEAQTTSESAPEDSENQEPAKKRRSRRDRRVNRATRRAAQAEAELEAERKRATDLEAELEELRAGAKPQAPPRLNDFDTPEEYAEAYADYKAKSDRAKERKAKPRPKPSEDPFKREIADFLEEGKGTGADFKTALEKANRHEWPMDRVMTEYLLDSDQGHQLFVALSKKPSLAREIASERSVLAKVEMLQDLEIKLDPESRPAAKEDRQRDDDGRYTRDDGGNQSKARRQTKAPPPGPRQERSGNSTGNRDLRDLVPKGDAAESGDLRKYMEARRDYHDRQHGRR